MYIKQLVAIIATLSINLFNNISIKAQDSLQIRPYANIYYQYNIDNREFDPSNNIFEESRTFHLSSLSPSIGITLKSKDFLNRLVFGFDYLKDMGAHPILTNSGSAHKIQEYFMYYNLSRQTEKHSITLKAGIIPKYNMIGEYGEEFFSDSLMMYDKNLDGFLFNVCSKKYNFELALDWMGKYSEYNRERFMAISYFEYLLKHYLKLGYSAFLYHYANSGKAIGVVDNALFSPFLYIENKHNNISNILKISAIESIHQERAKKTGLLIRSGLKIDYDIAYRSLGIHFVNYLGENQMPFFTWQDNTGMTYGNRLYYGEPFFRINTDTDNSFGAYSKFCLYWQPKILEKVKLNINFDFHYNSPIGLQSWRYLGCTQKLGLIFNLNN